MKALIATLIIAASTCAFAHASTTEADAIGLANVILDNPEAAAKLNEQNVNIIGYTVEQDGENSGVNLYTIKVDRTCFCVPKPGTLTVVQDLRPTFADGPIKYSYELTWDE